jgi:hypothetical protein
MNDQIEKPPLDDEEIISGLQESERYYEATSRVIDVPALIEEIRKRLEKDPQPQE